MSSASGYTQSGCTFDDKGDFDKAIADYNQALTIVPIDLDAFSNLAWLLAACPDENTAMEKRPLRTPSKAYQLATASGVFLATLAAAYAESGDFEKAKEWQAKAIELAKADKSVTEKDKAGDACPPGTLQAGKPYREELKK